MVLPSPTQKFFTFRPPYDGFLLAAMSCALLPVLTGVFLGFVSFNESEGDKHMRKGVVICFCNAVFIMLTRLTFGTDLCQGDCVAMDESAILGDPP
jgi:hypothetical protein